MSLRSERYRRPELPLVPLIDVLVMLVFFTFATMQFREENGGTLNLTLPKVETAGKNVFQSQVVIAVDKNDQVRVTITGDNGELVLDKREASVGEIENVAAELAKVDKNITVLIRSDEDVPLKSVTKVMDLCRKNGLNKIRLQTR
ncbi:MAG: biopolymer transporter ExbD [Opitutaceae bacterium]|nr:biopolymer transporter ExbD [Opitutaceae bacterium]